MLKRIQEMPIPDYWQRTTIRVRLSLFICIFILLLTVTGSQLIFNILLRKEMETNPQYASMKKIHDIKQSKQLFWNDMLLLISNYEHFDVASQWYINELYRNTIEILRCVPEWNVDADELVQTICRLSKYSARHMSKLSLDLTADNRSRKRLWYSTELQRLYWLWYIPRSIIL